MKHTLTILAVLLMAVATQAQTEKTKVYIPQGGNETEQVAGAARLHELVKNDGHWQLVDSENEADMVVEYKFSSVGVDNANLKISNKKKGKTYVSKRVSAHYAGAETSGVRSAEMLHERCLKGGAYDNDYRPWTVDGFYKLHARIGVGLGAFPPANTGAYGIFEGMVEYQISSKWAFGVGMDYFIEIMSAPDDYSSLGLLVDVVDYFPKGSWYTWFLRMKAGVNIPTGTAIDIYRKRYDKRELSFGGLTANIGVGIQWRSNLALEAYLGLTSATQVIDYKPPLKGAALDFGFRLSYNIPIKSFK